MLKSITYKKYIGYDEKTKLDSYCLNLEDDQLGIFEVVTTLAWSPPTAAPRWMARSAGAVIKFYSEKEPNNVTANLLILFNKYYYKYGLNGASQYYEWCKKYVPEIKPYQDEIEKLLMLQ